MKKINLPLILLLGVFFLPLSLYAQSGRKTTDPKSEKEKTEKTGDDTLRDGNVAPGGETIEGDILRTDTALVTVPVTVMDRNGRYVPLLRREKFRIMENGVEQKIAYFATTDAPFSVVLVIDTSGSTEMRLDDIHKAAISFVEKLKPVDRVMVMSFDDRIRVLCKATTDRDEIQSAIKRAHTGGNTRLYDAIEDILQNQLQTVPGRKAVVLFTDGVDTSSRASYDSTVRMAEESDAPIYSVDYDTSGGFGMTGGRWPVPHGRGTILTLPGPFPGSGGGASPEDYRKAVAYLKALSNKTGGRFYNGDSQFGIDQAFTWIAEELGRQYSLGSYPSTPGKVGERRLIKVRMTDSDLVVKSRDSYIYSDKDKTNRLTEVTRTNQ